MTIKDSLYKQLCDLLEEVESTKRIDEVCELIEDNLNARNAVLSWQIEELKSLPAEEFKQEVLTIINENNATQN